MRLVDVAVAPEVEPITLDEARTHLRVVDDAEDGLILALVAAAREWVEGYTSRALVNQGITLTIDGFPSSGGYLRRAVRATGAPFAYAFLPDDAAEIELPRPPCRSVAQVRYLTPANAWAVLDPAGYRLVKGSESRARLLPAPGASWPTTSDVPASVQVDMVCGYGATAASVPAVAKAAIKLLISHWYNNRDAAADGGLGEIPLGVEPLLTPLLWGSYR